MRLSARVLVPLGIAVCTIIGACGGAVVGGSTSGDDGSTKQDAAQGRDAPTSTPDVGTETEAATHDAAVPDEEHDDAPACKDAGAGQTGTDVCVPPEGPCHTACDCCWVRPFGSGCYSGYCYQIITQ